MPTRRQLLTLGAAAIILPRQNFAEPRAGFARVGFLTLGSRPASLTANPATSEFLRGMQERGHVEGKNYVIEWRFAERDGARLPPFAADLVRLQVDVIVAGGSQAIRAAQRATRTIPIVFAGTGDPVGSGFVSSLAHPGGNTTGVSTSSLDISSKLVELLRTTSPRLSRIAVLQEPGSSTAPAILKSVHDAAQKVGVQLLVLNVATPAEIAPAIAAMKRERVGALIVATPVHLPQIASVAAERRLLSIAQFAEYPEAGGLLSYGANVAEGYLRAATYVDKILKGAKPADLPVEQPTKFDLVINMKTAKALGIVMPQEMLIRATRLIE